MFPGGGAQHPGAARSLYKHAEAFHEAVEDCFRVMPETAPGDIRSLMFDSAADDADAAAALERPVRGLAALFIVEYGLVRFWQSCGIKPSGVIGHSAGEYAAAVSAGVMGLADALGLVVLRGEIFERASRGAMLAVWLSDKHLLPRLGDGIEIAAVNGPELCVASGEIAAIEALQERLRRDDVEVSRVRIDVAAHSSLLDPHLDLYRRKIETIHLKPPDLRFISTLTGAPAGADELTNPDYWVRQLRRTVRFAEGLRSCHDGSGTIFLEAGPGRTLTALARNLCGENPVIASLPRPDDPESDLESVRTALAQLSGVEPARASPAAAIFANDIERRIADFWRELLRVVIVQPEDEFFSLGGDSLAAVSLFAWIRREFGIDLPLATLFEAKTLRDLAARVSSRTPPSRWSPLVVIRRGEASRLPLFCIHGGGGNVLVFNALAQALGADQPVYGLQARGIDGREAPHDSIDAMADCYLAAIKEALPEGPYCLAGYSGGGVIAFEINRRLIEQGARVPLLVMFDTLSPQLAHRSLSTRILGLPYWSFELMRGLAERLRKRRRTAEQTARIERHLAAGESIPEELRDLYLWRSYMAAQARYRPVPFDTRLLLFRARRQRIGATGRFLGWNRLIQTAIEVHEVDCHHHSVMTAEPMEIIGRVLRGRLDEVNATAAHPVTQSGSPERRKLAFA